MKQIKLFYDDDETLLEKRVNGFCRDHNVIDIKYQLTNSICGMTHGVFVIYEEEKWE